MYPKVREFFAGTGRGSSLVRAFAGSAGLRAFGMALSFLVGVVLARGLGPAGYGIYGTAMSIIAVLMVPTEFGLPQMVTREVARSKLAPAREGTLYSLLRWTNRLVLVNSLLVAIGGAIFLGFISHSLDKALRDTLAWALALLPVVAIGNIYSAALRGSHRIIAGQLADLIIRPAMVCALLGGGILYGKLLSPSVAMMVNVVAAMVAAVYAVAALRPDVRESARFPRVTGARWGGGSRPHGIERGHAHIGRALGDLDPELQRSPRRSRNI